MHTISRIFGYFEARRARKYPNFREILQRNRVGVKRKEGFYLEKLRRVSRPEGPRNFPMFRETAKKGNVLSRESSVYFEARRAEKNSEVSRDGEKTSHINLSGFFFKKIIV